MKISSFFAPIAAAFRAAVLALSKADGATGLSVDDFVAIIGKVVSIDESNITNADKADWVAKQIIVMYGDRLPKWPWIPHAISWATHQVARRLGKVK